MLLAVHDEGPEAGRDTTRAGDPHPERDQQRQQRQQSDTQPQIAHHGVENVLRRIPGQRRRR